MESEREGGTRVHVWSWDPDGVGRWLWLWLRVQNQPQRRTFCLFVLFCFVLFVRRFGDVCEHARTSSRLQAAA